MRRILFVDHATALGGAEISLLLLLEHLDRRRWEPILASPGGAVAERATRLGVRVYRIEMPPLRRRWAAPWHLGQGVIALAGLIRRERIAVVHSNTVRASVYAAAAAALTRTPHLWHVRDMPPNSLYARALSSTCTAAVCVSQAVARHLPAGAPAHVLYNGVRLEDFRRSRDEAGQALRTSWGMPADAFLVGQVARLAPWKGQQAVIEAAAQVLAALPQARVAIVGGDIFADQGPYRRELQALIETLGLSSAVVLTGHREDVGHILAAFDVLVHASHDEPFGRILVEAGAAGLPVVAFADGAVPEIIVHEQTGLLVPAGDSAALAAGLRRLAENPALSRRLGAQAQQHIAAHFEIGRHTAAVEAVYEQILGGEPAGRIAASR